MVDKNTRKGSSNSRSVEDEFLHKPQIFVSHKNKVVCSVLYRNFLVSIWGKSIDNDKFFQQKLKLLHVVFDKICCNHATMKV
jgi:hypothetical protein